MEYTLYQLLWLFFIYSFLGWCAEVSMAAVKRRKLVWKGFLNAPFCLIYGASAVAFALFLPELKSHPVFLFLFGMLISLFLEYTTGFVLELIFHRKWWDYSDKKYHVNGYICLEYAILWGIGAVLSVMWGNTLILWLVQWIPAWLGRMFLWGISILLAIDGVSVCSALLQMHHKLGRIDQMAEDWQKFSESLGNALTRRIQKRLMHAYPNISVERLIQNPIVKAEKTSRVFAEGCSFYKLVSLFFVGAFLGDVIETIFCYVTSGVLMSRSSVVYGPFSIVWGLGCVLLTALLYQYKERHDRYIFLAGTVLGGTYEYVCSVFTELVFGTVFWDYSEIPFNLGGRINLLYCFFWGIVAVVWLKLIYPVLSGWIERIPKKHGIACCNLLMLFMVINMVMSGLALARYAERQAGADAGGGIEAFFDERFPDERIEKIYPNAKIVS